MHPAAKARIRLTSGISWIDAIEPAENPPISTVIGVRGPIAPADYCNGLMVPIVVFDQIYTFARDALIEMIPGLIKYRPTRFWGGVPRELF